MPGDALDKSRPSDSPSDEDVEIAILHVDDNPQVGELLTTYLEEINNNITVTTETHPADARERLESGPVDCIVSDHQMPDITGIEFLETVREDYPNLPFILFTGRGSEEVASKAINAEATSYLQKGAGSECYEMLANRIENGVDQRRSQKQAKVAKDRLLEMYEQAGGFYAVDEEWRITYWNQEMVERTGKEPQAVIGLTLQEAFPALTETELGENYRNAMEHREPKEFETYYEPHEYWLSVRVHPVDEGLFIHSRNINEQKQRELELEQRNEILESFANTVSHDLRNPLSIAEGKLQLAKETGDYEHLDDVAKAHNRMRNLIDELLRIARGEDLALSEVSLRESAGDAWSTVSSQGMQLSVEADGRFAAHDAQLRRLFENLFWNALEHGDAAVVRVGTIGTEGIYVEDDGQGIAVADRDSVFESGFSTNDTSPGYGLHIVEGIAEMHDWSITVAEGEDGGARFEIRGVQFLE
jgi:PAS domain S-box-containing protein